MFFKRLISSKKNLLVAIVMPFTSDIVLQLLELQYAVAVLTDAPQVKLQPAVYEL
jgi:hypothetical protein